MSPDKFVDTPVPDPVRPADPAPSLLRGNSSTEMTKLLETGGRLLRQKLDEHIAAVSAYERKRVELLDSYRVRMERLKIDGEYELRALDDAHYDNIAAIEKLIGKLKALRED